MIFILSVAAMVLLDQAVKLWAVNVLEPIGSIPILEGIFHLTYVENRGAAFSMLQGRRMYFLIGTLIVFAAIIYALHKGMVQTRLGKWSLYLIFGGALGNYIDRLFRQFVVDMFYIKLIDFPVFNVADIFVCVGAALFFYYMMFQHKDAPAEKTLIPRGPIMSEQILLNPTETDCGKRIDSYLSEQLEDLTRSAAQRLLNDGAVCIGGKPLKKNYKIEKNVEITVILPEIKAVDLIPENLPIDIVYEDDDIIVVNKARGMVVHPAVGNWNGTLVNALMYHCGERLSGINGELRPGIVHRIDKDTSGLLVVAKNDRAHQHLSAQIQRHDVRREYEAIVIGRFREPDGTVDLPIGRHPVDRKRMAIVSDGREAVTHYQTLADFGGYSHMAFQLETGRTHQIRVHMAAVGHPIIGDPLYGAKKDRFNNIGGQCLHAAHLTLTHPTTGELMRFDAPIPDYFAEILAKLEKMA